MSTVMSKGVSERGCGSKANYNNIFLEKYRRGPLMVRGDVDFMRGMPYVLVSCSAIYICDHVMVIFSIGTARYEDAVTTLSVIHLVAGRALPYQSEARTYMGKVKRTKEMCFRRVSIGV